MNILKTVVLIHAIEKLAFVLKNLCSKEKAFEIVNSGKVGRLKISIQRNRKIAVVTPNESGGIEKEKLLEFLNISRSEQEQLLFAIVDIFNLALSSQINTEAKREEWLGKIEAAITTEDEELVVYKGD